MRINFLLLRVSQEIHLPVHALIFNCTFPPLHLFPSYFSLHNNITRSKQTPLQNIEMGSTVGLPVSKLLPIAPFTLYYLLLSGRNVAQRLKTEVFIGHTSTFTAKDAANPTYRPKPDPLHGRNPLPLQLPRHRSPRLHLPHHRRTERRKPQDAQLYHGLSPRAPYRTG